MALTAGYDAARGDAIITIDADLQHPPHSILSMIYEWEKGYSIVYARRVSRNDNFFKKYISLAYYWFLDLIADVSIPRNVSDFRLIDRRVLESLATVRETTCYWRGMVAWTGYPHTFVEFKQADRAGGVPGYTWAKSFQLALHGITGFSSFPLKIAGYIGILVIATGFCMFIYITYDACINHVRYPLFKWLTTIVYIFMGVQFLLLWLIGEYVGRIYMHQKQRPLYVIKEEEGFVKHVYEDNADSIKHIRTNISSASNNGPGANPSTF